MRGCKNEMNLETFTDLAREFYFATIPDGMMPYMHCRKASDQILKNEK
jgi:hypothetical protein